MTQASRLVAHALFGFSVVICARQFWELKPHVQGMIVASLALALLVSGVLRRGSGAVSSVVTGTAALSAFVRASVAIRA
jgi:hypothetical protein